MIKKTKFSKASKASKQKLRDRINYITDVTNPNHAGMTIMAARNYRCPDNTPEAFEEKAVKCFERYDLTRRNKKGNRTKKLFEEHIYSSTEDAFLTDSERRLIEKALIENAFNFVPVRTAWHIGNGRSDLHILSAGYSDDIPPSVHLSTDFGHGKRDFLLTLERAERDALDIINSQREKNRRVLSAREVKKRNMKKAGIQTLGQKLSGPGLWDGSNESITKALQKLGYQVLRLTKKSVSIISPERLNRLKSKSSKPIRPRRYSLETLRESLSGGEIGGPSAPPIALKRPKKVKKPEIDLPPLS